MSASHSNSSPSPIHELRIGTLTVQSPTAGEIEIPVDLVPSCPCCSGLDAEVASRPSEWFVGRDVKLSFPTSDHHIACENMCVQVESYEGDELSGTLISHPLFADIEHGDGVTFHRDAILAVEEALRA